MLKRILVILVFAVTQAGCDYGEDLWPFERYPLNDSIREGLIYSLPLMCEEKGRTEREAPSCSKQPLPTPRLNGIANPPAASGSLMT